jgi:hypothetical protein
MWIEQQVSLYSSHADNLGRPATYREILLNDFFRDLDTLIELRKLDHFADNYKKQKLVLKSCLQCYTPAALLATKAKDHVCEIHRTGIMQLDFDHNDIAEYDIEELKQCVFNLPFIGFCGKSCSGDGFYALALIAEPERLSDYAEHCFAVLETYGIKADTSKGKKVENLRYLSYDSNMLIRDNPEPLHIKRFKTKPAPKKIVTITNHIQEYKGNYDSLVKASLNKIHTAKEGKRWQVVGSVAYTLGGTGDKSLLDLIEDEIENTSVFADFEKNKYCIRAQACFAIGLANPLSQKSIV